MSEVSQHSVRNVLHCSDMLEILPEQFIPVSRNYVIIKT